MESTEAAGGANKWVAPSAEEVARLLPQYHVEKTLGRGGMGAVYLGRQPTLRRPVAIKLLPSEMAADREFIARFEQEAQLLARLQHPSIVTVHDCGRTAEGHLYFVMEYVPGTNLREILRGPGLQPEQALLMVGDLCDALNAAHREGIVHRDIKPENVLVTKDGRVKLVDFGLARPPRNDQGTELTRSNMVMGTPEYMAPEQLKEPFGADHRADIFALGVMLYEMLTGQTPRGAFDPPSHKVEVDVRVDEVVLKAMRSEPERRYQMASEFKQDVDQIRASIQPRGKGLDRARQPAKRLAVGGGVFLLSLAGWLGFQWKNVSLKPAEPAVSAVSKEHPFVNSLGMKFVPLPAPVGVNGTPVGNAASSARVLFAIWPVRMQDYAAFVSEAKVDSSWLNQEFHGQHLGSDPLCPVVAVSWDEGQEFCQWLTEKEVRGGILPPRAKYRFPTDEEWSRAVGLPPEQGATPAEKKQKDRLHFPWGFGYPPKTAVGNYADSAWHNAFPQEAWMEGYTDGFATTSPVGSFPANALGIYDIGGNVWQYCEDWFDNSKTERVLRGAAWCNGDFPNLLSSQRVHTPPYYHVDFAGLRCVLELKP